MTENEPSFVKITPIEKVIRSDGKTGTKFLVTGKSDEDIGIVKEALIEGGMKIKEDIKISSKEEEEIVKGNALGTTFGFRKWNSSWNPKDPKPNWVAPENPSKN
jgi:hypothetical protein